MPDNSLKLTVIIASMRTGRSGSVIAQWFLDEATKHGEFDVNIIDLAESPPPLMLGSEIPKELVTVTEKLELADAFVVVTPEYNHSFPASIKSLIDWHFTEWRVKPVGFVSYGGLSGGLRAVEQLRLVFAEMHAVAIRDTVSFANYREIFETEGDKLVPRLVEDRAQGPRGAAKVLLDQLAWWATALREARLKNPYQA